eukprot:1380415-Amorphochlora_amoeboformis.AAC.1
MSGHCESVTFLPSVLHACPITVSLHVNNASCRYVTASFLSPRCCDKLVTQRDFPTTRQQPLQM